MQRVIDFLNGVRDNNNREWFMAHRDHYLAAKELFDAFALDLVRAIGSYDPTVRSLTLPQVTYRIYRDVRFSPDKSPYKRHMGVYVCRQGKKSGYSGYYFQIAAEGTEPFGLEGHCLAAGDYSFDPKVLRTLREDIAADPGALRQLLQEAAPFTLDESFALKHVPRGFDPADPAADLLKYKAYCMEVAVDTAFVTAPDLARRVAEAFRPAKPFIDFLNRAIDFVRHEG